MEKNKNEINIVTEEFYEMILENIFNQIDCNGYLDTVANYELFFMQTLNKLDVERCQLEFKSYSKEIIKKYTKIFKKIMREIRRYKLNKNITVMMITLGLISYNCLLEEKKVFDDIEQHENFEILKELTNFLNRKLTMI